MNCSQNEKLNQVTEETLVIGVDIAHETQWARAFDPLKLAADIHRPAELLAA